MPLTTGHQKVQTNIIKGYRRPQQYTYQHCQLGHVSPGLSLLVSVCVLMLPMLGLVDEHVQLTTTCHISPINQCYIHSPHMTFRQTPLVLILPSLDNVLPAAALQNRVARSIIGCPSYTSSQSGVRHVLPILHLNLLSGLGRRVVGVVLTLLLLLSGDIETNPGPVGQQLSEMDLLNVMEELADVRAKWYNIGLGLGLSVGTLDGIKAEHSNISDCLREALTTWLKAHPPLPTWSKVVDALRTKTVGEARLATDLECKYCSSRPALPTPTITTSPQVVVSTTAPLVLPHPPLQPFPITQDSTPHSHPPTPAHTAEATTPSPGSSWTSSLGHLFSHGVSLIKGLFNSPSPISNHPTHSPEMQAPAIQPPTVTTPSHQTVQEHIALLDKQSIKEQVKQLQHQFRHLGYCTYKELADECINVHDVHAWLISLDVFQQHEHQEFIKDHLTNIEKLTSLNNLWARLGIYWNFLNFDLLEHLVNGFGSEDLKQKMVSYNRNLQSFRKATRVCDFIDCWPSRVEPPPGKELKEFVTKVGYNWEDCTLEDLDMLQGVITRKFFLPQFALRLKEIKPGSIVITWLIPVPFVKAVLESIQSISNEFFVEQKLESITIDGQECYTSPTWKPIDYSSQCTAESQQSEKPIMSSVPEKFHSFKSSEEPPFPKRMRLAVPSKKVPLSTYPGDTHQYASGPRFLPATELSDFVIKVDHWENCTFRDLKRIKEFITHKIFPYEFTRLREFMEGSVTISWLIPAPFVKGLQEAIETTSSRFFMEQIIENITIDGKECNPRNQYSIFLRECRSAPSVETQCDTHPGDTLQDASAETELREFVMKLGHHWENCTLNDFETIKEFIISNFFPSEFVLQLRKLSEGNITITWLVPPPFVRDLQENVQHTSSEFFMEQKIATITSDGQLCYPYAEEYVRSARTTSLLPLPSEEYVTKYKDYLSSTPAIRAALYTTFNAKMAAEVFTWSQYTESPPPTTMTELFTAFTLKTLVDYLSTHPVHHKRQLKVTTFSDLPTDVYKQFQDLCRMAYEGLLNKQQLVFSTAHLPTGFAPLGLMREVPQLYTEGRASSYYFIHSTLQEYLAAVHISQLPAHEQTKLFEERRHDRHFKMTIRFLAGLTKLINIPPDITKRLMDNKLTYIHFLFEAKGIPMTTRTLGSDEMIVQSDHSWTPLDYYVTGHAISHSNCPWRLHFYHSFINDEKFEQFCQGCTAPGGTGCRGHILGANFSGNGLASKSIYLFINIPPHILQNMRELVLGSNKLDKSAYDLLAKAVPSMSRLEMLRLGDNPTIGCGGAVEVIKALCGSGVKWLYLYNTGIGEPDCEALCELLKSSHSLRELYIYQNNLSSESVASIIAGLSHNSSLTILDVSNSHFNMVNVVSLASLLRNQCTMTWLVLEKCQISGQGASELAAALCKNSTLKRLVLDHNPIGVEGASSMSDMLQQNTSLGTLYLCDDSVGEEGVHQLINSLKHNQTLRILRLPEKYKTETSDHRVAWW